MVSRVMLNNYFIKDNSEYKQYIIDHRYRAGSYGLDLTIVNKSDKEILYAYYNIEKSEYRVEECEDVVREACGVRCYEVQNTILKI